MSNKVEKMNGEADNNFDGFVPKITETSKNGKKW